MMSESEAGFLLAVSACKARQSKFHKQSLTEHLSLAT